MGIRIALGASSRNVTGVLMRYTLTGVAAGVVVGVIGALFASRALEPYLFGIDATDRTAYLGSVALLCVIGVMASWLPSRRATHVEPAVVLRGE
jgi:ABC-type antimicrobial peptide transport system permease subunit